MAGEREFQRSDAGNGEYFARLYGERVRYDHRRGRWLTWAGQWWREDDTRVVRRLAKEAARDRYGRATAILDLEERKAEARFAIATENRQRLEAMLVQSQAEPPIADAGDRWDDDPSLLGVANGVVDLRTGALRPGSPADRITLHTDVDFQPSASCGRWERFLDEVFAGDDELVDYIARAVGYSLTGDTSEQCLFTCYGTGSNGKSVFLSVVRAIAGRYAANTPFSTFELRSRSAIPNDVAALVGKRVVTASETGEDTRLNESRLKALTGGDPVTARFLHGEFFTYQPVAKFWLAVNHKPRVSDDSYGFWRRVRLVPFVRQFEADADMHLLEKLRLELPGILAWAVRGALAWREIGLQPPAAVTSATETYRAESDPLAEFVESCLVRGDGLTVPASAVYKAYKAWASEAGLSDRDLLSATAFGRRMGDRCARHHTKSGNIYLDVGLVSDRTDAPGGLEPVKGWVKGSERGGPESTFLASRNTGTRENRIEGLTTLHPSLEGRATGVVETSVAARPVEDDYPPSSWNLSPADLPRGLPQ